MTDLHMIQDAPYTATLEALNDDNTITTYPGGSARMMFRVSKTATAVLVDVSTYLTKTSNLITMSIPASVTVKLPKECYYDLWVGDTRLMSGRVLTDPSVTRRSY